jgi:hypothetical protein
VDILSIPMEENDAKASTIGEYLVTLLATVWEEEGFSGKRPFGNSGWKSDVYAALIKANAVQGKLDEDGYVESIDRKKANSIVEEAIQKIYRTITTK